MRVNGIKYRTIWQSEKDKKIIQIIDQRLLPHKFKVINLQTYHDAIDAISDMAVRGAPLIGGTAAWSMYLASIEADNLNTDKDFIKKAGEELILSRPTAVNLKWAVERILDKIDEVENIQEIIKITEKEAKKICDEDVNNCENIGKHGLEIIKDIANKKNNSPVNILTHCNAGWLATIDRGTATAPIYAARDAGIDIHIWVDETRPRNQGASLTAWELSHENVDHTLIVDNVGGHLMQHGLVGSDRTTRAGDVGNKIGTYLKALAAFDNNIPFYVALPDSTIDWSIRDGVNDIPIEERDPREISHISGIIDGEVQAVDITYEGTRCMNFSFDVTPAKYVTGLITPRGVVKANENDINQLYPEY